MGQTPWGGRYPARSSWGGTLPGGWVPCWGVPCQGYPAEGGTLLGGTLPGGYPARGSTLPGGTQVEVGQQQEYSIHGRQYASCVHTGGLSCFSLFVSPHLGGGNRDGVLPPPHVMSGGGTPTTRSGWVPPANQVRLGYHPPAGMGYPLPPRIGYAWTGYAAGGMPLAVSRRRTFL